MTPEPPKIVIEHAKNLYVNTDLPLNEIAARANRTAPTILKWRKKYGWPSRKKVKITTENERFKAMIAAYWAEQGFNLPEFYNGYAGTAIKDATPELRSDMLNGMPRKKK